MKKVIETQLATHFLVELREIKKDRTVENFITFLKVLSGNSDSLETYLKAYEAFINSLYDNEKERNFSKYIKNLVENKFYQNKTKLFPDRELNIIKDLTKIDFREIKQILVEKFPDYSLLLNDMPKYVNPSFEFNFSNEDTEEKIVVKNSLIKMFDNNRAFIFDTDLELKPLDYIDAVRFSDLKGYKEQKRVLYENTLALLDGRKVNNILLYGDAGCGKSTSVRALLNEFKDLRMVQIFKNNLINLDKLYKKLAEAPYKFIIFADDISFDENDETFSTMKAILEGSLIQCPKNVTIYATSNRRHLVNESFKARKGDEVHLSDTLNEMSSLSERFGINLFFGRPSMEEFIEILLELAHDNHVEIDDKHLIEKANRMAMTKGSRSPRIAKQLIDNLLAHVVV